MRRRSFLGMLGALLAAPLGWWRPKPMGDGESLVASDTQTGISIRMVRSYDIEPDQFPSRLDVLCGLPVLTPDLACRVTDAEDFGQPPNDHPIWDGTAEEMVQYHESLQKFGPKWALEEYRQGRRLSEAMLLDTKLRGRAITVDEYLPRRAALVHDMEVVAQRSEIAAKVIHGHTVPMTEQQRRKIIA